MGHSNRPPINVLYEPDYKSQRRTGPTIEALVAGDVCNGVAELKLRCLCSQDPGRLFCDFGSPRFLFADSL